MSAGNFHNIYYSLGFVVPRGDLANGTAIALEVKAAYEENNRKTT